MWLDIICTHFIYYFLSLGMLVLCPLCPTVVDEKFLIKFKSHSFLSSSPSSDIGVVFKLGKDNRVCICSCTLGGGAHIILELDHLPGHQNPPLELSSYLLACPPVLEDCWKSLLQECGVVCICSSWLGGGEVAHVILELDHPLRHPGKLRK